MKLYMDHTVDRRLRCKSVGYSKGKKISGDVPISVTMKEGKQLRYRPIINTGRCIDRCTENLLNV
jgi:hypothetical protein